ncbi:hypothetical protein MMC11_008872 [Xylographa trunciseda]|nr:hypothetical protein [Xylographa trunciseda]
MSVIATSLSLTHTFSKTSLSSITLLPGLGVQGDCHSGITVQHRSRLHIKPAPPNLRQVHLIHSELFSELSGLEARSKGEAFVVKPGDLGENITTMNLDLLALSAGTKLHFLGKENECGEHPIVRITGLRNPCPQIDGFANGLKEKCLLRDGDRQIVGRKSGIMGVVEVGGEVRVGDTIVVEAPVTFKALECV